MRVSLCLSALVAFLALGFAPLQAAEYTKKDAEALVAKAAAYYKANGEQKTIAALQDKNGEFVKENGFYVFLIDFNCVTLANAVFPMFVGKNHAELEDVNGKKFVQEMAQVAKTKGSGWIDYMFKNPGTGKVQAKTTYVLRVEGKDYFFACGIFKPEK